MRIHAPSWAQTPENGRAGGGWVERFAFFLSFGCQERERAFANLPSRDGHRPEELRVVGSRMIEERRRAGPTTESVGL
jgi:hypothetical protein